MTSAARPFLDRYAGKTVLVTGGGGYVGSALIAALSNHAGRILRMSRHQLPSLTGVEDVIADPRRKDAWECAAQADVTFHLAAETSVYAAATDPEASLAANVVPVLHALAALRPGAALIAAGTVTQFGLTTQLPVTQASPDHPVTVYDLHKLMAEKHIALAVAEGKARGCLLRLANVYGPSPVMAGSADRGILNKVVAAALASKPVSVFGHGNYLRDYIYIDDVVAAFLAAGVSGRAQDGTGWIIASGTGHPFGEAFRLAVRQVALITGTEVPIGSRDWPPGMSPIEFRNFVGDSAAFSEATGWSPTTSLVEGIAKTIAAFQAES